MQEIIVYIILAVVVVLVAIRIYRILTNRHTCCGGKDGTCHCEGCELANECNKEKCKNEKIK